MKITLKSLFVAVLLMTGASCYADVVLKETTGQTTSFAELKGKWVLINYWAGWCHTCIDEIPEFNRFYESHKKDKVALYAVNYDNPPLFEQNNLIRTLNINYPNLTNDPARELHLGDIRGVPVTFVFNPKGELVKTLYGGQTAESLDEVLADNSH